MWNIVQFKFTCEPISSVIWLKVIFGLSTTFNVHGKPNIILSTLLYNGLQCETHDKEINRSAPEYKAEHIRKTSIVLVPILIKSAGKVIHDQKFHLR